MKIRAALLGVAAVTALALGVLAGYAVLWGEKSGTSFSAVDVASVDKVVMLTFGYTHCPDMCRLHYTLNYGFSWHRQAAMGLRGEPRAIAVHTDDPKTVALATSDGLFLSRDAGGRFRKLAEEGEGLSVFIDLEGKFLWYSSFDGRARLQRIPLDGRRPVQVQLPPLKRDAVAYSAQNPARKLEYAIATFGRNVYLSKDAGESWRQIAERGEGR